MKLCIDTNAYSSLKMGNTEVLRILENADEVLVPTIVLGELYGGFFYGKNKTRNADELDAFLEKPGILIVDISKSIAERYGILIKTLKEQGTPIPSNDIWIAAVVMDTGSKLLSQDSHFQSIPGIIQITF